MYTTNHSTIERSIDYFTRAQDPCGYWMGELESNATITAEYLFLYRLLGRADPQREREVARQLLATQVDGGWPLYYGAPPDLNTTLEAAIALQIAGLPLDDPALRAAAEIVRELGGLERARVFTRIWLALLGALPWTACPNMPPELMLLPDFAPLSIYRFASWARSTLVPLLITLAEPPHYPGTPPAVEHFFAQLPGRISPPRPPRLSCKAAFLAIDGLLKRGDPLLRRNPWRPRALELARRWVLDHQEVDGGWGGIQPAMVNSVLGLYCLDGFSPAVERGLAGIEGFGISKDGLFRMQSCVSPGWDTPWTILALAEAGLPGAYPAIVRGRSWLLGLQSRRYSDWSRRTSGAGQGKVPAGGWPFEFANQHYPDTDDTALVLLALHLSGGANSLTEEAQMKAGLEWLLAMQNPDGGWAAFDRENTTGLVQEIPFCDFGEVLDPSSADVTAHILELLGRLGFSQNAPPVRRGLAYLWREQQLDGAWFGRWGVNYIYGTAACLVGLAALGFSLDDLRLAKAVGWLCAHQNPDGGWGELCDSYINPACRGWGPSTASQTAWALLGLSALARPGAAALHQAVAGGCRWLRNHQNADGSWDEPYFTGTGFPGDFYIKYHEYRNYFPLLALARTDQLAA